MWVGPFRAAREAGDEMVAGAGIVREPRGQDSGDAGREWWQDAGRGGTEGGEMSTFGDDPIQSMHEALAHAKGDGPAVVHAPMTPRKVRERTKLTQAQMAPLMGMSLSGYRKWEQGTRRISGPAATLLRVLEREPADARVPMVFAGPRASPVAGLHLSAPPTNTHPRNTITSTSSCFLLQSGPRSVPDPPG